MTRMAIKIVVLSTLILTIQSGENNAAEPEIDLGAFADIAGEFLQSQGAAQGLGAIVSGLMEGGMMPAESSGGNLGQVMRGLSNMIGPNAQGIDTQVLTGILGMMGNAMVPEKENEGQGPDVLSAVSGILGQPEMLEKVATYAPMAIQTFNAFFGPEAQKRKDQHEGHAWYFPPILEKVHLLADHFVNSDIGREIIATVGAEKVVKIFSDETGRFSYDKYVELMENHSFRRHWIHMVTARMMQFAEHYADPKNYQNVVMLLQHFLNNFLKGQGYPRSVMFDMDHPDKSMAALIDFLADKFLSIKINSKQYIYPLFTYATGVVKMVRSAGEMRGGTEGITAKLADSINMEIIEPIAKVNRGYRYLKKNPACDKYVICLVNQGDPSSESLPGIKSLLSKGTSFVIGLMLNGYTQSGLMTYYNIIMNEQNCEKYFSSACSDHYHCTYNGY